MPNMTTPTGTNPWLLEHSKTLTAKSQSVTITLSTAGTYLDKDIKIVESITAQNATTTMSISGGSTTPVISVVTANTSASIGTLTTTKPTSGHYIAVNTGKKEITATATFNVSAAGWIPVGDTNSNVTVTTNAAATAYVPITAGTVATEMSQVGLSDYFEQTVSTGSPNITITPKYTATEGYIDAASATNNGGTTYWKVKQGAISTATASQLTSTYSTYTAITTAVVPAEGGLIIGAGYYPNTKITLASLIPDDASYDNAGTGEMLKGYEAYDTDGKKLIGTIETMTLSNSYYTTTAANGVAASIVTGGEYYPGPSAYIKSGTLSSSVDGTSVKPVISAKTNTITGKTNVTGAVTTATESVSSPYFVAIGTSATTGTVTGHANVTTAGWITAGDRTSSVTITASASDITYVNVAQGKVKASGGGVNVSATSSITTSMTTTTSSTGAYAITVTATGTASRNAVSLTADTHGYVSGASGELTGLAKSSDSTNTVTTTIYILKYDGSYTIS